MTQQRLLPIKHGYNFRDLGGYQTSDGHTVKWHRLIRSGALNNLDEQDQEALAAIPVTVDIDLRSKPEITAAPDRVPRTAKYYHLPVFSIDVTNASRSDEEVAREMQEVGNGYRHMQLEYRNMVQLASAQQAYQELFQLVLSNQSGATLFHCTAGKDRTGFGAYLLLTVLGVPRETILQDYLLTNDVTAAFRRRWVAQLRASTAELGNRDAVIKNRSDMMAVFPGYLTAAIETVNRLAGSPTQYLTDCLELTRGDLADLRRLYLD